MVQPGSATVTSASAWVRPASLLTVTVTRRVLPGWYGAAISTGTSNAFSSPGFRSLRPNGPGSRTPAPCTLIVADIAGVASRPGPSFTSVTRTPCSGRCAVPVNRSVDSTLTIRICPWLHDPGRTTAPDAAAGPILSSMAIQWSGLGPELLLRLDRDSDQPLRSQLETGLRDAIRDGRLQPGERLASSREFARELGVSRGLVQECYGQLLSEGYLDSHVGSATKVAARAYPAATRGGLGGASGAPKPPRAAPAPRLIADFR